MKEKGFTAENVRVTDAVIKIDVSNLHQLKFGLRQIIEMSIDSYGRIANMEDHCAQFGVEIKNVTLVTQGDTCKKSDVLQKLDLFGTALSELVMTIATSTPAASTEKFIQDLISETRDNVDGRHAQCSKINRD